MVGSSCDVSKVGDMSWHTRRTGQDNRIQVSQPLERTLLFRHACQTERLFWGQGKRNSGAAVAKDWSGANLVTARSGSILGFRRRLEMIDSCIMLCFEQVFCFILTTVARGGVIFETWGQEWDGTGRNETKHAREGTLWRGKACTQGCFSL